MKKMKLPAKVNLICTNLCAWVLCVGTCISSNNILNTYEHVKNNKLISNGLNAIGNSFHLPIVFCILDIIFIIGYVIIWHTKNERTRNKQSITGTDISCLIACAISAFILFSAIGMLFFSAFFGTLKTLS